MAPALTFPPERLAVDAMIDMLDAGIHHVPVVDADGTPVGRGHGHRPDVPREPHAVRAAPVDRPRRDASTRWSRPPSHLPQMVVALIRAGVAATDIGRVLALQSDTATMRLIDLALERHGAAPSAWAWMALGSTARREATLASDQDNALAYADGRATTTGSPPSPRDVNEGLARCGFGADNAEVLARNRQWRMSEADWRRVFRDCLEQPDRSHLVRAAVAFDFRHVCGGLQIVRAAGRDRAPGAGPPGLPAPPGPHGHRLGAAAGVPRQAAARRRRAASTSSAAASSRSPTWPGSTPSGPASPSRARSTGCAAAAQAGAIEPERAAALEEALRARHPPAARAPGGARSRPGLEPTNRIAPADLAPLARGQLRSALREVADAQHALARFVPLGM